MRVVWVHRGVLTDASGRSNLLVSACAVFAVIGLRARATGVLGTGLVAVVALEGADRIRAILPRVATVRPLLALINIAADIPRPDVPS